MTAIALMTLLLSPGELPRRLRAGTGSGDGLGDRITETGPSWTGQWTRRPGTNIWDATYQGGSGQPTTMTVTRNGNMITAARTFSGDGNLCTYQGTIAPDGVTATGQGTCPSGYTFPFTLRLLGTTEQPPPQPTVTPLPRPATPVPPPPTVQVLGPLSLDAYCQSIEYTLDLGGVVIDIVPYDGAVADGEDVYCAALNVLDSGIDVYSDPVDLNQACLWQYGQAAGVRPEGANPPSWTCIRQ